MPTHPLWRPFRVPDDEEIARFRLRPHVPAPVEVVAPDPRWPADFARVRARIAEALGPVARQIEHVGSTAVPGLWAKPVIDVLVAVADPDDEAAYVPAMEAVGFVLGGREPDAEQHRFFRGADPTSNVHVFPPGSREGERMRRFRDWLRTHADDRAAYAELKRELARQGFTDVMHYNNAKAGLIYDVCERIFTADPQAEHDPRPRGIRT
ncbi:GrpB domain, predicted nucleotidyltransferase, UPF0157 family [Pseudonocardia thermophila]|uniref:GrpB domain, predicted nucleotidyltransferase, UPF0157 family n=1 Tax=Pseudonocardia thermophila TaxID=1848 RepID=A0A1M6SJI8_PSETH|nr:GrpB family protein [Pseudonocardia thermophila]SHK44816.1 GrpB domain, predicted nucleotidyltransferase, UPF0157 family [Pseudonocardia thermophila]